MTRKSPDIPPMQSFAVRVELIETYEREVFAATIEDAIILAKAAYESSSIEDSFETVESTVEGWRAF